MKRVWAWLNQFWNSDPPPEKFPEDPVVEKVLRIRRKMEMGTWTYSWQSLGARSITVIHPNLPYLTGLINRTRTAMLAGVRLPDEALRAPHSINGVEVVRLDSYLANSQGRYRSPPVVINEFIDAVVWLSEAMKEARKVSPIKVEAWNGQCNYLYKEIVQVAEAFL